MNFLLRNFETRKRKGKEKKRRRICVSRRDIEIHRDREIAVPSSPIRIRLATLGSSHKYLPRIRTQSALYADPSETYGDFLNYGSRDPGQNTSKLRLYVCDSTCEFQLVYFVIITCNHANF